MAIISEALGEQVTLRIDANCAWTEEQAIRAISAMEGLGIESVEQPVAAADHVGMRRVREATGMLVMANESLLGFADALGNRI